MGTDLLPNDRIVRVGVATLVRREGRILMHLRKSAHGTDTWSFPGGYLEHGETPEEAALREIEEETGLTNIGQLRPYAACPYVSTIFASGKHHITLVFDAHWHGHEPEPRVMEPEKCARWEWFDACVSKLPAPLFDPVAQLVAIKAKSVLGLI